MNILMAMPNTMMGIAFLAVAQITGEPAWYPWVIINFIIALMFAAFGSRS